jgi:hypothetical protein
MSKKRRSRKEKSIFCDVKYEDVRFFFPLKILCTPFTHIGETSSQISLLFVTKFEGKNIQDLR